MPAPLADFSPGENRTFLKWTPIDDYFYQGEVNQISERDGRGILIFPKKYVEIGYHREGKCHGPFI